MKRISIIAAAAILAVLPFGEGAMAATAAAASAAEVSKPSFDCAKAQTLAETIICADPALGRLDVQQADALRKAMARTKDKAALKASNQSWLKSRNACQDIACLSRSYRNRIAQLKGATAPAPAAPPAVATTENSQLPKLEETGADQQPMPAAPAATAEPTPAKKLPKTAKARIQAAEEAALKAEEDSQRRIAAAEQAAADAEAKAQEAIQRNAEEVETARKQAEANAQRKLEEDAKKRTQEEAKAQQQRIVSIIETGSRSGYGILSLGNGERPVCYIAGSEGQGITDWLGLTTPADLRTAFIFSLHNDPPHDMLAQIKIAKLFDSAANMVEGINTSVCGFAFGNQAELNALLPQLKAKKVAYDVVPVWFSEGDFDSRARAQLAAQAKPKTAN